MADTKVSGLTELAAPPDAADKLLAVDVSDTTMAASGTDKWFRWDRIFGKTAGKAADGADTEYAFSAYRYLAAGKHVSVSGATANTFILWENQGVALNVAASAYAALYLDPADFGAGSRTVKLRIRAWVVTNTTAPAINFTFHLYPVATWGTPTANSRPSIATVGASVLNAAINTPAANGPTTAVSGDVTFPAAGYYCIAVVTSGTSATNSQTECGMRLDLRQV